MPDQMTTVPVVTERLAIPGIFAELTTWAEITLQMTDFESTEEEEHSKDLIDRCRAMINTANQAVQTALHFDGLEPVRITTPITVANTNAAQIMLDALIAQEEVDDHVAKCDQCGEGEAPESCEVGFPIADRARLLRWEAIAAASGKPYPPNQLPTDRKGSEATNG